MAMVGMVALASVAGCNSVPIPTTVPTDIAGLSAAGTVTLTEAFVDGFGEGEGVLTYRGRKYPFRLIGSIGPGSVSSIGATGEIYKLNSNLRVPGSVCAGHRSSRPRNVRRKRPVAAEQGR
jgi:hypothetical protein